MSDARPLTKSFDATLQDSRVGADEVIALITTDSVDRDHEVVIPSGIDLENYRRNPLVMFGHARGIPQEGNVGLPVGRNLWIKPSSDGRGLVAKTKFDVDEEFSASVYRKVKGGFLNSWSITFIPRESGPPTREEIRLRPDWADAKTIYRKCELIEYSCVAAPANTDAVTVAKELVKPMAEDTPPDGPIAKGMVPYRDAPESDAAWDAGKARAQFKEYAGGEGEDFDPAKYGSGFAVVVGDPKELGSFKFPHHYVSDSKITTVRQGVASAIAACKGARSGETPEGATEALDHLMKHARELGLPSGGGEESKARGDEPDADDAPPYARMRKDLVDEAGSIKHSGKRGHLHAHEGEMKAHWHAHPDDFGDDAEDEGYHSKAEIRERLMRATGITSAAVATRPPAGEGWERIYPEPGEEKEKSAAAMTETVGSLGGFALGTGGRVDPDRDGDDDRPGSLDDPDEAEDLAEAEGIRRYSFVKLFGGQHHKGLGRVHSIHTRGMVPDVENDVVASKESPVARVQLYKAYQEGHLPTEIHVGHHVHQMEQVDDLKPPARKPATKPVAKNPESPKTPAGAASKAVATPVASPLSADEVLAAHTWGLIQSGKISELVAKAAEDAMARALGRG